MSYYRDIILAERARRLRQQMEQSRLSEQIEDKSKREEHLDNIVVDMWQRLHIDGPKSLRTSESYMSILQKYFHGIENLPEDDAEYFQAKKANHQSFINSLSELRRNSPILYPLNLSELPCNSELEETFQQISQVSVSQLTLPQISIGYFKDTIQEEIFYLPAYVEWQDINNNAKNIIIDYDEQSLPNAELVFRHALMSILLALPPKAVHITFVNTKLSTMGNFFTSSLDESIYTKVSSVSAYHTMLDNLLQRIMAFQDKYGDSIEAVNEAAGKIVERYELVVLLDDPDSEVGLQEQLIPLFEKGNHYGIYFIGLNNTQKGPARDDIDNVLNYKSTYQSIDAGLLNKWTDKQDDGVVRTLSIANNPIWAKAAFEYINSVATKKIEHKHDWNAMAATPYKDTDADIVVPIGYTESGEVFNFRMDVSKQHYHAFVIGATGSGKSRFLHDVILSMTTKYSPEDLELYLMDFKGVEFNCYRDFKHVRTVLVDRADERITYEVIKDLKVKMEQRQRILAQAGASDVAEYNREHMGEHLSQIILIADECQTLFADRAKNGKLQNEMVDIIALIAQQGRAYGVHLLLATQSLANAPQLGKDILNQISEHYILPCLPADAGRLVPDHARNETERVVAKMEKGKGQCYYQGAEENVFFTYNYVSKGEMQSQLVLAAVEKAQGHKSNGQVFFSGSLQYSLDERAADYIESKSRRAIVASPGQEISLEQTPLTISLKDDMSENILLMGINDEHFVTRTSFGVLTSLMLSNIRKDFGYRFMVLDCLADEEAEYIDVLDHLEDEGLCQVISGRKRGEALKRLCDEIASENVKPTILFILGQERFRELKLNIAIEEKEPALDDTLATSGLSGMDMINNLNIRMASTLTAETQKKADIKTIRDAVNYILDKGPELGVHTVMQLDKPNNFLFPQDGYFRKQDIYAKFKHLIVLRSDEMVAGQLMLRDDIRLHTMESNPDRLRAYYYNEESDKYALFTPYLLPNKNDINNLLK